MHPASPDVSRRRRANEAEGTVALRSVSPDPAVGPLLRGPAGVVLSGVSRSVEIERIYSSLMSLYLSLVSSSCPDSSFSLFGGVATVEEEAARRDTSNDN
jgi:hypothetical protein